MKLEKFKTYSQRYEKDPRNFEKMVIFASPSDKGLDLFETIHDAKLLGKPFEKPVVTWNGFELGLNESHTVFNRIQMPEYEEVADAFKEEPFIPKTVSSRNAVSGLTFPITGISGSDREDFKTLGKFKKSEKTFDKFREKLVPLTRFSVLAFKGEPIHIQEKINKAGFDIDPERFKYQESISDALKKIHAKYPTDFQNFDFIDVGGGRAYLESFDSNSKLTPSQLVKMYESVYENYYETRLPSWFKNQLFEKYVKPYLATKYFDSMLLKPKNSMDFKKFI